MRAHLLWIIVVTLVNFLATVNCTAATWFGASSDQQYASTNALSITALSESKTSSAPFDVTFVTQASIDRVWLIADICSRWPGPIVLVVFLHEESPLKTSKVLLPTSCHSSTSSSSSSNAKDGSSASSGGSSDSTPSDSIKSHHSRALSSHDSRVEAPRVKSATFVGSSVADYPVNHLRNLGIGLVRTSHFMVADVDFVPSRGLYAELLRHGSLMLSDLMLAVVVPAFQRRGGSCTSVAACRALAAQTNFIPANFDELQQCMAGNTSSTPTISTARLMTTSSRRLRSWGSVSSRSRGSSGCIVFQADNNYHGHSTTRSSDWLAASAHWLAPKPLTCFESSRYEPYLVLSTWGAATPRYDEQFTGYGKNKIQFVNHVRFAGFQFAVLPREFLMHFPHPKSSAKLAWLRNSTLHQQVDNQFVDFLKKLTKEYSGVRSSMTPICSSKSSKKSRQSSDTKAVQSKLERYTPSETFGGSSENKYTKYRKTSKKSLFSILSEMLV